MKLQPNEMPNSLLFALRLTEVTRWGIVAMSRQQSVGEHSFRVCMIAQAMYDYIYPIPHNSDDRNLIVSFAMCHDIMEVLSGDLDAIFKLAIKAQFPDVYDSTVRTMATQRRDAGPVGAEVDGIERAVRGTFIEVIVKVSDFLEALIYLDQYGTNSRHAQQIRDTILERMWAKLLEFKKRFIGGVRKEHWDRVEQFINLVLNTPGMQEKAQRSQPDVICGHVKEGEGMCGLPPSHPGEHNHYVY